MEQYTPIRCPEIREHGQYTLCSRLLGAAKDGKLYLYCEQCKRFYEISIGENDVIDMKLLPKKLRLEFGPSLRIICE